MVHIGLLYCSGLFGKFEFAVPVSLSAAITVDLIKPEKTPSTAIKQKLTKYNRQIAQSQIQTLPLTSENLIKRDKIALTENLQSTESEAHQDTIEKKEKVTESFKLLPPLRLTGEFMGTVSEKFTYRIFLLGIPVGHAELLAKRNETDLWITLRVTSDAIMSSFYPVDDFIETRHINGNFIITKIRQREGSFLSNRCFTIFLRDKQVFWIDHLKQKGSTEKIPNSDVIDLLTGIFYLRNCKLVTGTSETVEIYDSDSYAPVEVEVIQRETVNISALREFTTLLVQPQLKTDGIFRRTGAIQIWFSDDAFRVPVKFSTTIPIGRITAELVSAESHDQFPKK